MSPLFVPAITLETPEHRWLKRRLTKPQRHRLSHGYPLAAAMPRLDTDGANPSQEHTPQAERGLLVGVLPHPFCNPKVRGCGFCTFPHQMFHTRKSEAVVEAVIQEIKQRTQDEPGWTERPVSGLYFGGGTANLTPPESFRRLCRQLRKTFDLSQAEVTLEGVPAYFLNRKPLLIDILQEELPARHFRLSMGVQTNSAEGILGVFVLPILAVAIFFFGHLFAVAAREACRKVDAQSMLNFLLGG